MSDNALKHNVYFDGRVQSVGFARHGRRATVGVIAPGSYHFSTDAAERMTVISGELAMRRATATTPTAATPTPTPTPTARNGGAAATPDAPGADAAWTRYPAGTAFEIPGRSGFDVRADEPAAYLCEFL